MEASERVATVPSPLSRRDEALAAGEVAEGARRGEVAVVGDALAAGEVQAQVGAARAGDVGLVGLRSSRSATARLRAREDVEVDVHEAGEHVGGDGGHRRAARPVVARALARLRVRERARGRRDEDVARGEGLGDRRRRLDAVVLARGHDGEHRVGLRVLGLAAQRLPHVLQRLVDDHETFSAGATARQRRTTVRTARARPVMGRTLLGAWRTGRTSAPLRG